MRGWVVEHNNILELVVAADVIGMGVGIDHDDWFVRHLFDDLP